ncbi:MAG TPA: F0F1 ATP synthase subunit A, partial [Alphaproteobacteria bacterium]|nr:F0F1 ATP synthase subunit A [Alphaproteobacteria bacterium]
SELTSTGAMAVRLFGNVLSGVIIGAICMMLVPFILPLPMQVLGLFTGMIQAYIFAMLALMYVSSVQSEDDDAAAVDDVKNNKTL